MLRKENLPVRELRDELFRKNGSAWFRVASGSMSPLIDAGDKVLVKRINPSDVKSRDIILFEIDGVSVAHRVIKILRHNGRILIIQKGDAGGQAAVIEREAVAGRVAAIDKKGRVLSIENGRGRVLSEISGLKNTFSRLLNLKPAVCSDSPGPYRPPGLFRVLRKPYRVFNRLLVKIFFA